MTKLDQSATRSGSGKSAIDAIRSAVPTFLSVAHEVPARDALAAISVGLSDIRAADSRLRRWAPALVRLFPELAGSGGIIESALIPLADPGAVAGCAIEGRAFVKTDHALPVAGSIKARGGIYEVLAFAEQVGVASGLMAEGGSPEALLSDEARAIFANYRVGVGSTGNLGLSIGVMASALGFSTTVHMSSDAKEWKKERLRKRGVNVVEHEGDYAAAVAAGRDEMENDASAHFVDDENSMDLLLGYAVAALRIEKQLTDAGVTVDAEHPVFVYLPCGVGGAPGGITVGMKHIYGDAVHCFFGEPVASPAFLVRMNSTHSESVYDWGLDNRTEADGLAVAQASELVYELTKELTDGFYTVADDELFDVLYRLERESSLQIEPSSSATFLGPVRMSEADGPGYMADRGIDPAKVTHIFWTTGGSFVPEEEYRKFHARGASQLASQE
ncbi:D-serine ammonia-lyase [Croceicoccus bisphenolivorans]|uniref:D-serine ammonia-lyase n=1 Tax=Croceicoccus bisphenolivorans TaxID=1783232 RepID=UPI00082AA91C|nr:D-serine ammonia-lyase [Croceicoccus bisphenolivorans]